MPGENDTPHEAFSQGKHYYPQCNGLPSDSTAETAWQIIHTEIHKAVTRMNGKNVCNRLGLKMLNLWNTFSYLMSPRLDHLELFITFCSF